MTEVAIDVCRYWQRHQYSECVHLSVYACSIQECTEFLSETSSKSGVSCWSVSLACFSCITQAIQDLCLHKSPPKPVSETAALEITVTFQVYLLSGSVDLSLFNTCILKPLKGCKALDLTSYFFSNILPYETSNRPKLSKYSTLSLIKGCAKKRLKPIREKTLFLSCIQIVSAVIYAVKLWSKSSCFVFD